MKHQSGRIKILNPRSPRSYFGVVLEIVDMCRFFVPLLNPDQAIVRIKKGFLSCHSPNQFLILMKISF